MFHDSLLRYFAILAISFAQLSARALPGPRAFPLPPPSPRTRRSAAVSRKRCFLIKAGRLPATSAQPASPALPWMLISGNQWIINSEPLPSAIRHSVRPSEDPRPRSPFRSSSVYSAPCAPCLSSRYFVRYYFTTGTGTILVLCSGTVGSRHRSTAERRRSFTSAAQPQPYSSYHPAVLRVLYKYQLATIIECQAEEAQGRGVAPRYFERTDCVRT